MSLRCMRYLNQALSNRCLAIEAHCQVGHHHVDRVRKMSSRHRQTQADVSLVSTSGRFSPRSMVSSPPISAASSLDLAVAAAPPRTASYAKLAWNKTWSNKCHSPRRRNASQSLQEGCSASRCRRSKPRQAPRQSTHHRRCSTSSGCDRGRWD